MTKNEPKGFTRRTMLSWMAAAGVSLAFADKLFAAEPRVTVPPYNDLTDEEEIALGRKFAASLEKDLQIVDNPLVNKYLNGMVADLSKVSQRPRMPYYAKLVNTMDVNAFSIPGGGIYVYRGLVQTCDKEDELSATLSHEIGHIVGRHAANKFCLNVRAHQLYEQLKDNVLRNNQVVAGIIEKMGGPFAILAMLHFQRQDEFEADMLGFYECVRANYQPKGFLTLFGKFEQMEKKGKQVPPFLLDHPPSADRAARIQQELTQVRLPANMETDSFSFQAFRGAMNLLPEPPKPVKH